MPFVSPTAAIALLGSASVTAPDLAAPKILDFDLLGVLARARQDEMRTATNLV